MPPAVRRAARTVRADLPGLATVPTVGRFAVALVVAVLGSLAACAVVAAAAVALVPSLAGYDHLHVGDWAKLTVIGVVLACFGWPFAAAIWSRARLPFLVLTIVVTVASFVPDLWILRQGQPALGVLALAVMHVAVAVVTYPVLVLVAPQRRRAVPARAVREPGDTRPVKTT
ncbi:hypothetical protein GCM10009869_08590 [Amnibacterium kyonggiense]